MPGSTSRLVPAPDMQSDAVGRLLTTRNGPAVILVLVTPGAGPSRHTTLTKVPTMAKRTRGFLGSDSRTRISAVTITPASSVPATVPSIPSLA